MAIDKIAASPDGHALGQMTAGSFNEHLRRYWTERWEPEQMSGSDARKQGANESESGCVIPRHGGERSASDEKRVTDQRVERTLCESISELAAGDAAREKLCARQNAVLSRCDLYEVARQGNRWHGNCPDGEFIGGKVT